MLIQKADVVVRRIPAVAVARVAASDRSTSAGIRFRGAQRCSGTGSGSSSDHLLRLLSQPRVDRRRRHWLLANVHRRRPVVDQHRQCNKRLPGCDERIGDAQEPGRAKRRRAPRGSESRTRRIAPARAGWQSRGIGFEQQRIEHARSYRRTGRRSARPVTVGNRRCTAARVATADDGQHDRDQAGVERPLFRGVLRTWQRQRVFARDVQVVEWRGAEARDLRGCPVLDRGTGGAIDAGRRAGA